jgi:hypothetical protein
VDNDAHSTRPSSTYKSGNVVQTSGATSLGIAACLYAYSHLSFGGDGAFVETCAEQYHLLRDYMLELPEARGILGAID